MANLTNRNGGLLQTLGLHRPELRAWALYDVANSAFACTIMVAVLPIYFADVIAEGLSPQKTSSLWAYISSIATVLAVILAPLLGVIADEGGHKKRFLAVFTGLGASCSALLCIADQGNQWLGIEYGNIILTATLYILASLAFASGEVFYESLLPHIANEREVHRTSSSGYALGYFGGGLLLAINLAWISLPDKFGFADAGMAVKASFISVGVWWIGFSIPLFKRVSEPKPVDPSINRTSLLKQVSKSLHELLRTIKSIMKYREAFFFLLAFWFYSDGVLTIMKMAAVYGREVGISSDQMIAAILMVQFLGVPFTFLFGPLADHIGSKNALRITIIVYLFMAGGAYFMSTDLHFWLLAFAISAVQGGCQALSRSIYSLMIPRARSSEFFSFFSVSSKFAGIFGTLIFGLVGDFTKSTRAGLLFIVVLFIVGLLLLQKVDIEKGQREAGNAPA